MFSGVLTEIGWRWVFLFPAPLALLVLLAAIRLVPNDGRPERTGRFDVAGAVAVTAGMLLLVFTLVEAPEAGWTSVRTLASIAGAVAILAGFVVHELRTPAPLVRLGILRSNSLVRANFGAMALIGGWFGFQFIVTLYLQQLRGWSALETGLALFPAGLLVAFLAPRMAPLVSASARPGWPRSDRVDRPRLRAVPADRARLAVPGGDAAHVPVTGLGFGLAYGPLNIAATNGIEPHEQGLAGGLVNTSFQFGGALVLAIATAVNQAGAGAATGPTRSSRGSTRRSSSRWSWPRSA